MRDEGRREKEDEGMWVGMKGSGKGCVEKSETNRQRWFDQVVCMYAGDA